MAVIVFVLIPPAQYYYFRRFIYVDVNSVPEGKHQVMVLGAGIRGESPSAALQERLDVATALYSAGKIDEILVSGATDADNYDEPKVMKAALVKAGVPENLIIEDGEGYRTFDSCRRAKEVYSRKSLIIISQGFHLPRALFLCRSLGIDAEGVYSTGAFSTYYNRWYTVREVMAMYLAVWDVLKN